MLIDILKPDFEFNDERGSLKQLFRRGYSQVNVIHSKKGAIRGKHYHKYNTEAFYMISGKCMVIASVNGSEEKREFKTSDFFRIRPGIMHCFEYLEDTVIVSMYSLGVEIEDGQKDIYD